MPLTLNRAGEHEGFETKCIDRNVLKIMWTWVLNGSGKEKQSNRVGIQ